MRNEQESMEGRYGGVISDVSGVVKFFNKNRDTIERVLPLAEKALTFACKMIDSIEQYGFFGAVFLGKRATPKE